MGHRGRLQSPVLQLGVQNIGSAASGEGRHKGINVPPGRVCDYPELSAVQA